MKNWTARIQMIDASRMARAGSRLRDDDDPSLFIRMTLTTSLLFYYLLYGGGVLNGRAAEFHGYTISGKLYSQRFD